MGKIAFVFPGQGSQYTGMCKDLYEHSGKVKEMLSFAQAKHQGILELMWSGPKEKLDITINTQPALFLTDLACAEVLAERGITPDGAAGFSLGEVPGVCFTGLMNFDRAFDFVCYRAKVMHECAEVHKGAMFAVLKLTAAQVEDICSTLCSQSNTSGGQGTVCPVNYNCPGQTVVACSEEASGDLHDYVLQAGGKALKLAVSGAFHSPFMNEASDNLAQYLEQENFSAMQIPLYANMTAAVYDNPAMLLAKQVNHPVLWQKTIENMISDGFDTFIETGPGKTLSGLIKKINPDVRTYNVFDLQSLENTVKELNNV